MTETLPLTIFGVGNISRRREFKVASCCNSTLNTLDIMSKLQTLTLHWADTTVLNQFFVEEYFA
jgi:hypothetical protein